MRYAPTLSRLARSDRAWAIAIALLALVVRAKLVPGVAEDPATVMPVIDSHEYVGLAYSFLQYGWVRLANHTPLYPMYLAAVFALFGVSTLAVALVQYGLGAAVASGTYLVTRRFLDRTAAVVAGVLVATYWFLVYVQSWLFAENLSLVINLALFAWLAFRREGLVKYAVAGVLLGLSVLSRPEFLFFGVTVLWFLWTREPSWRALGRRTLVFTIGVAVMLVPVMTVNQIREGSFLLRTQTAVNLLIGNDPERAGSNIDLEVGIEWNHFITLPRRTLAVEGEMTEAERNRFYLGETARRIGRDPYTWCGLILGKVLTIATGREMLRSVDVYFYDRHVAGRAISWISTPLLFCLAFAGLLMSLRERRKFALLHAVIAAVGLTVFFASKTRYLMPYVPFFAMLGGYAVSTVIAAVRQRHLRGAVAVLGGVVIAVAVWALNPLAISRPDQSEALYAIGDRYRLFRQSTVALRYYRAAAALDPANPSIHHDMAAVHEVMGDLRAAWHEVNLARVLAPPDYEPVDCTWRRIRAKRSQPPSVDDLLDEP